MATLEVTNTVTQQALKAQAVRVILDQTETVNDLPSIAVGQSVYVNVYNIYGIVSSVDSLGNSFQVSPVYPFNAFQGSQNGYLVAGDVLTVTI
jgi:hypothetical protein